VSQLYGYGLELFALPDQRMSWQGRFAGYTNFAVLMDSEATLTCSRKLPLSHVHHGSDGCQTRPLMRKRWVLLILYIYKGKTLLTKVCR
jgi:hypothetical protein